MQPTNALQLSPEAAERLRVDENAVEIARDGNGDVCLIARVPAADAAALTGRFPAGVRVELFKHSRAPVIRLLVLLFDQPERPYPIALTINPADADQRAALRHLTIQESLPLLMLDEFLRVRTQKRIGLPPAQRARIGEVLDRAVVLIEGRVVTAEDFAAVQAALAGGESGRTA